MPNEGLVYVGSVSSSLFRGLCVYGLPSVVNRLCVNNCECFMQHIQLSKGHLCTTCLPIICQYMLHHSFNLILGYRVQPLTLSACHVNFLLFQLSFSLTDPIILQRCNHKLKMRYSIHQKFWEILISDYSAFLGQKPGQDKHDTTQIPHTSPVLKVYNWRKLFGLFMVQLNRTMYARTAGINNIDNMIGAVPHGA